MRGRSAAKRAAELAERQFGAVARHQLLSIGLSSSRIGRWIAAGWLHPRYPGTYALGRAELGTEGELLAALLYAGPGAALGGVSALWCLELLGRRPVPTRIDTPRRRAAQPGLRLRRLTEVRRSLHRDVAVARLPDALLAATCDLTHDSLRLVLARADFRKILDLQEVEAASGPGRTGSRALRAALGAHLPQLARCANGLERDFVLLCERYRLPLPEVNARLGRYRPDMLWREARQIVELDGRDAHSSAAQLTADARRQADLERLGFIVVRFTWAEVRHEPARVATELTQLLATVQPLAGRSIRHIVGPLGIGISPSTS